MLLRSQMSSLKRLGAVGKMFVPQQFKPSVDKEDINMAKGENIFKRKDGRWEARYIKGYELSGKIKYGFCYGKTYREAKEKGQHEQAERHRALRCAVKLLCHAQHQTFGISAFSHLWPRDSQSDELYER